MTRYGAVILFLAVSMPVAGSGGVARTDGARPQHRACVQADGGRYSAGALVKVRDQIQACVDGTWAFPPDNPPADAEKLAKQKSCRGAAEQDKDQDYASGILRAVGDKVERCDDGKWVKR
jgi:hypothetical protein